MKTTGQFVIQKHSRPGDVHWDLMLESEGVLETWRLDLPPEKLLLQRAGAARIFDHPVRFLTYQGPVNNGLGSVEIADKGSCELLSCSSNRLEIQFDGDIVKGKFELISIEKDKWALGPSNLAD